MWILVHQQVEGEESKIVDNLVNTETLERVHQFNEETVALHFQSGLAIEVTGTIKDWFGLIVPKG
jgi:hypothetical protein